MRCPVGPAGTEDGMRRFVKLVGALVVGFAVSAFAAQDIQKDKRDLKRDTRDLKVDQKDVAKDRADLRERS